MKTAIAVALFAVATIQLPDTPEGALVRDYFDTYNRPDAAAMKAFMSAHVTEAALTRRTEAERKAAQEQLHAALGKVTVTGMESPAA